MCREQLARQNNESPMNSSTFYRAVLFTLTGLLLTLGFARADLVYQPATATPSEESADWKKAANQLLRGTSEVWMGFAEFEADRREAATNLLKTAAADYRGAADTYSLIAKKISNPRHVDMGRFKALEPAIAQRILAGRQVPENERDAAELASKQISALLEWAENHSGEIYSFKIRTLQEFGLKVNELSWRGVDVAILMQEGLQQ